MRIDLAREQIERLSPALSPAEVRLPIAGREGGSRMKIVGHKGECAVGGGADRYTRGRVCPGIGCTPHTILDQWFSTAFN